MKTTWRQLQSAEVTPEGKPFQTRSTHTYSHVEDSIADCFQSGAPDDQFCDSTQIGFGVAYASHRRLPMQVTYPYSRRTITSAQSLYRPSKTLEETCTGFQSTRTLTKSYHANSYPSQLVPNYTNSYLDLTNSYPIPTRTQANYIELLLLCIMYHTNRTQHNIAGRSKHV